MRTRTKTTEQKSKMRTTNKNDKNGFFGNGQNGQYINK